MNNSSYITYLNQSQIDKSKWDRCIASAQNGLIYGYSFYLDNMSKNWDALVLNDYEIVMPLTWNKKFGFTYLYQPFLTSQLGIFGNQITEEIVVAFLQSVPAKFQYIDISMNYKNMEGCPVAFTTHRSNYVLDLNFAYDFLYGNFKENIQRNIKKAHQQGCIIKKDIDIERIIELAELQMKELNQESKENIDCFRNLYANLLEKKMTTTYAVLSSEDKLLASCVFFFSHNRAYYILVGNHPDGKTSGASHALIDTFIKDNAGKDLTLDFEGSDIASLAHFYNSFGAENEIYPALKINKLPFYLKWLKAS